MNTNQLNLRFVFAILLAALFFSCKYYVDDNFRATYQDVNEVIYNESNNSFFKVHLKNGDVSVMESWEVNSSKDTLLGTGQLFNYNRKQIKAGSMRFSLDEIAIIETNQFEELKSKDTGRIIALSILTAANIAIVAYCAINPKACFGSCPTFYVEGNNSLHTANAEGFSSSIAPILEMKDLDALQHSSPAGAFYLTMKNEAMETHVVNEVYIEAVPKNQGEKIYADRNDNYYRCRGLISPDKAIVEEKDVLEKIKRIDELEYFSVTDSLDLFSKEEIYLSFEKGLDTEAGLVINFRQTLLSTFLLYSALSYMGNDFGEIFARIETSDRTKKYFSKPYQELGGIKVFIRNLEKEWVLVEEVRETGPIAKNLNIVPLPAFKNESPVEIKLELTRGLWRIDHVALTQITDQVVPVKIAVSEIRSINGQTCDVQDILFDDQKSLISLPGDEFKLKFELPEVPDGKEYELFLSSKGYYLEWIRQEWLEEKDVARLRKMVSLDKKTWRELAIEFKSMEHEMEDVFWNSKYSTTE